MITTKQIIYTVLGLGLIIALVLLKAGPWVSETKPSGLPTFTVKKGPLTVNIVESGTIKARDQIIIKNEVEGRTSIIYLIPEGTQVSTGDLLVELDASSLMDSGIDQDIKVQNAEAAHINAIENLAVEENQAKSDIDLAVLTLDFAEQDLKKYMEGEYPNELRKADAEIALAKEELTRAEDTLKWSRTLAGENYISQTELQADQLSEKKKTLDLELAINQRELLTNYTYKRELAKYRSDVSQAEMALERTQRKARAGIVQAQAELKAKNAEYQRQQDKLKKIKQQIIKTKIYAPADGLVIYATSAGSASHRRRVEPLEEGQDIRERQELIYLPTGNSSKAEISIHESNLKKIRKGMPVVVTIDALPEKRFDGKVFSIAPLPDAQSIWMNPDLKVYTTEIYLDTRDPAIRTGMNCQAEIILEHHTDAFFVPVQAILQKAGNPTVWVKKDAAFPPQSVVTGLDNNRMIHIRSGLRQGDVVLLTPPLKEGGVEVQKESPGPGTRGNPQKGPKARAASGKNAGNKTGTGD